MDEEKSLKDIMGNCPKCGRKVEIDEDFCPKCFLGKKEYLRGKMYG